MMMTRATAAVLGAAVMATACNKRDEAPPPAQAERTTPEIEAVHVGKSIGADRKITSTGSTFGTRDTIYVSVETEGTGQGTLVARWLQGDSTVVRVDTQSVALGGETVTEFHIMRPRAWPAGSYHVEVSLNGGEAKRESFEIR